MKGEGMVKELKEKLNKVFETDDKEINEQITEAVLKQLDNIHYAYDHNLEVKQEDVETLKAINNVRLDNKKAKTEVIKNVAQTLGVTVGMAATIVGIIYTVKGFDFDCRWMEEIWNFKDSLNVMDNRSFNQVAKNRDSHKKLAEHLMNSRKN